MCFTSERVNGRAEVGCHLCTNRRVGYNETIVGTVRSAHSRKHTFFTPAFPKAAGASRSGHRLLMFVQPVMVQHRSRLRGVGLQKPGPRRGSAALKHPGTCSPHPADHSLPSILAKGPGSVRGPRQAAAGRGLPQTGDRGRTGSAGSGEPYGPGASQAAPATGQMAAEDGGWRRIRETPLTIILEASSVARYSCP